ncbi:MAG: hypothetical protein ABJN69_07970 [Hellea sp.]
MQKKTKPLLFLFFFIAIIWPLSFLLFRAKSPEDKKVSDIVASQAFLSTLQNKDAEACIAMTYMDSVDVIILGSSVAYSNIDPVILPTHFGGQSVAVCALPGWNTEFFDMFFKYLEENNIAPSRIVWLADGASHLKFSVHEKRIENAKRAFFDDEFRNKTAGRWIENFELESQSKDAINAYDQRISYHSGQFSDLKPEDVTQIILETEFNSETAAATISKTIKPVPGNKKKLQKLCANIVQRNIILDVIVTPTPTTSDDIFTDFGDDGEASTEKSMAGYYAENIGCVRSVISDSLESWGLDNRYFLNRRLKDDYPYDLWKDPASFGAQYDTFSTLEKRNFYDTIHLNGIGAVIFTEELAKRLR